MRADDRGHLLRKVAVLNRAYGRHKNDTAVDSDKGNCRSTSLEVGRATFGEGAHAFLRVFGQEGAFVGGQLAAADDVEAGADAGAVDGLEGFLQRLDRE